MKKTLRYSYTFCISIKNNIEPVIFRRKEATLYSHIKIDVRSEGPSIAPRI